MTRHRIIVEIDWHRERGHLIFYNPSGIFVINDQPTGPVAEDLVRHIKRNIGAFGKLVNDDGSGK